MQRAPDAWSRARGRKLPVIAAFSHAIATKAMERIEKGKVAPEGENAYDKYLSLTEKVDEAAGYEALAELCEIGGTFENATEYFKAQIEVMNRIAKTAPQAIQQHGKVAYTVPVEPPEALFKLLVNPMIVNARGTTMSVIIGQALRICLREKHLPEAREISEELGQNAVRLADLTQQPTAIFYRSVTSKEIAQKILRQHRLTNKSSISATQWPAILHEVLTNGTVQPAARELGKPPHNPTPTRHKLGHCAAQLYLQPYEHPRRSNVNKNLATRYFKARGLDLKEGSFRTADYQVLRGIEVAENTLFSDPACRLALEALANHIQTA